MNIHFAREGHSTYTHVSDEPSTLTKVIVSAAREAAHYVLDDFLGNATDLPNIDPQRPLPPSAR